MGDIKFYDVTKEYISYLKNWDTKIPNINYNKHDKFICGVVLKINEFNYYAPISSFTKSQKSNFVINNETGVAISSIRFSFMFPAPQDVLSIKDFNKEESYYKYLLMQEYKYCNLNKNSIYEKAESVYKRSVSGYDKFMEKNCCDFRLLENKCSEYKIQVRRISSEEDVAVAKE